MGINHLLLSLIALARIAAYHVPCQGDPVKTGGACDDENGICTSPPALPRLSLRLCLPTSAYPPFLTAPLILFTSAPTFAPLCAHPRFISSHFRYCPHPRQDCAAISPTADGATPIPKRAEAVTSKPATNAPSTVMRAAVTVFNVTTATMPAAALKKWSATTPLRCLWVMRVTKKPASVVQWEALGATWAHARSTTRWRR
jgi:hypothetical protein